MALPTLRARLADGFVLAAWSSVTDPLVAEALLRAPFDALFLDMQHGAHDAASVLGIVGTAAIIGKPAVVRVPVEDRATVSRVLDFGASAVVMPMIESAADAARFVSVAKYPPLGSRSFGPTRAADAHGYLASDDYTLAANRETLAFAMIETRAALDDIDAIAAVDGLDGVFVGPSDLSIALSPEGRRDPERTDVQDAIRAILAAAERAGVTAAIYAFGAEDARRYRDLGFRMVGVASDLGLLKGAATRLAEAVKG